MVEVDGAMCDVSFGLSDEMGLLMSELNVWGVEGRAGSEELGETDGICRAMREVLFPPIKDD